MKEVIISPKAIEELDESITQVQDGLAIICNGNTHAAIENEHFAYVKNHPDLPDGLYQAKAAIAANEALSTSNLTADPSGGLNKLKEDVDALNSNIGTQAQTLSSFVIPITAKRSAYVVVLSIEYTAAKEALTKNQSKLLGTLPEAYRPSGNVFTSCLLTSTNGDLVAYLRITVETNGNLTIYPSASIATSQTLFGSFEYCI